MSTPPAPEPSEGPQRSTGGAGSGRGGRPGSGKGNRGGGGGQGQRSGARPGQGGSGASGSSGRNRSSPRPGPRSGSGSARGGQSRSGGRQSGGRRSDGRSGSSSTGRPGEGGRDTGPRDAGGQREEPPAAGAPTRSIDPGDEDRAAAVNSRRALGICAAPSVVLGVVAGAVVAAVVRPLVGLVVLVVVAVVLTAWFRARAPHAVLRAVGARPSDAGEHPRVHNLVEGLCATMGLPPPAIYVVDDANPNALAVGREPKRAALVVTSTLERALSLVELEGVLAHELVHVKRRDTATAGAAVAVVAPLAAVTGSGAGLVRTLVGPGREFIADQRAASVVRYPPGLGTALETMTRTPPSGTPWPPGPGRVAAVTRWLWIDPMVGARTERAEGNLDDTAVRAATLAER